MIIIDNYLRNHIDNWYRDSLLDYDINGRYISAEVRGNDLHIIWEEELERREMDIAWFGDYTPEQLYNIWMELA